MKVVQFVFSLAIVVIALSARVATAAVKDWTGGNGNWNVGNNWSGGTVPQTGDTVNIVSTTGAARTVTYNPASALSLGPVTINHSGPGSDASTLLMPNGVNLQASPIIAGGYDGVFQTTGRGAVNQSAGTTTIASGKDLILAWGNGSAGTYTLSGGSLVANQSEWVGIGGTGTFDHSGGTNTINASMNGNLFVGGNAGSTGTYNLSGTASLTSNKNVYIGYSGTGFFNQTGGTNTIQGAGNQLYLGFDATSLGFYTIDGGTLTAQDSIVVGGAGIGELNILPGGSVWTNSLSINNLSRVDLNGGTLRLNGYSNLGTFNYSAGAIKLAGTRTIGPDPTIAALFSTTVPNGKGLTIEGGTGSVGTLVQTTFQVNGGSLTSEKDMVIGFNGEGALEITNGGTVISPTSTIGSHVGVGAGSQGDVLVAGDGSFWLITQDLLLASGNSQGSLTIQDEGRVYVTGTLTINNDGIVTVNGGTIRFDGYSRGPTGVFNFNAGTIQLPGDQAIIGSDAAIQDLFGVSPTIPTAKGLTVEETATLLTTLTLNGGAFVVGDIVNSGLLDFQKGSFRMTQANLVVGAGGQFGSTLQADAGQHYVVDSTASLTANGLLTISSGASFTATQVSNSGEIVLSGSTARLAGTLNNSGVLRGDGRVDAAVTNLSDGEIRVGPNQSLIFTSAELTNSGHVNVVGGAIDLRQGATNSGVINLTGGTAEVFGYVNVVSGGRVSIGGSTVATLFDDVTQNGLVNVAPGSTAIFFGDVSGSGSFPLAGTIEFLGEVSPGNSPGTMNFGGNVALHNTATLHIELGGSTAGSQYDQINVAGDLALAGMLEISLINGFTPAAGQTFDILDWFGTLSGSFTTLDLPELNGLTWNTSQLYSDGILSLAAVGLPGDYNNDGRVDGGDYVRWRNHLGDADESAINNNGDGGGVTISDYTWWKQRYGNPGSGGGGLESLSDTAVPEPAAICLALTVALVGFVNRLPGRRSAVDEVRHQFGA